MGGRGLPFQMLHLIQKGRGLKRLDDAPETGIPGSRELYLNRQHELDECGIERYSRPRTVI